jgi:MOSC domain-containing protein YiiM
MEFKELFEQFSQPGTVSWIGVRPDRMVPLIELSDVLAIENLGLQGDRYQKKGGARQVTLIQHEHLVSIASFLGKSEIDPQQTRRNIVVRGINLMAMKGKKFTIGEAVFEYSGDCHPCSRMEVNLGPGGYNAMRGLGGITAKVIKGGKISLNDPIEAVK